MGNNILLETIKKTLDEVHIETGGKNDFDAVCLELEREISNKILIHEIDFYTESNKVK